MESTKVVSEQKCPTGHGVIILSREYPGPKDQQPDYTSTNTYQYIIDIEDDRQDNHWTRDYSRPTCFDHPSVLR